MELERELQRELPTGHVLQGHAALAIARRQARDDVVFVLDDGRICVVHLTWSVETNPNWPYCFFVREFPRDGVPFDVVKTP